MTSTRLMRLDFPVRASRRGPVLRHLGTLAGLAAAVASAACSEIASPLAGAEVPEREGLSTPAPEAAVLAGRALWVNTSWNPAAKQASLWADSRPADAAALRLISEQPQAVWFNGRAADVRAEAERTTRAAAQAGRIPVLVAYNIPYRDCGSYSAGGERSGAAYRSWIREFAAGIGARSAVVVLEPDALASTSCLSATQRTERSALLKDAIAVLKAGRGTMVYLDAGHARWLPAADAAARLTAAGLAAADGFALNVSNFVATSESIAYGAAISARVGGKRFVIDTSRNGNGPAAGNEWCNPAGRALGEAPTTATGHALVDAFLWVKRPGESDGTCNGGPAAGSWWAEYALGLAQRSQTLLATR